MEDASKLFFEELSEKFKAKYSRMCKVKFVEDSL